jgi:hypothetical protein
MAKLHKKVSRKRKNLKNKTSKKYLRMYGGTRHTVEMSEVMLGIPVTIDEAAHIIGLRDSRPTEESINAHLKRNETQLRITVIGKVTYLLGYYLEHLSDISTDERNGEIDVGLKPIPEVIDELQEKSSRFKTDLLRLKPDLDKVTLSQVESDEIEKSIAELEPYLFTVTNR